MELTRRDLSLLLPALAASTTTAQNATLPSKIYVYENLPVRESGQNRSRAILNGKTRSGLVVESHETDLAPGLAPHAAHKHVHEELVFLREGTLEVTIEGKATTLTTGSIAYVASNEMHGWKNVGTTPAKYYILTLGQGQP